MKHRNIKKRAIDMKRRALAYAARNLPVLPMHTVDEHGQCLCRDGSSCSSAGKHPRTKNGVADATTDRAQIEEWWKADPDANIGIRLGKESGIIALDIDPRHSGTETLKSLQAELGKLPTTVTGRTGGGAQHLIYAYPAFRVRKDTAGKLLGPGLDILSDGCIMIAPPSRHACGKRYRWAEDKSFRELKPAPLPEPWLDRLRDGGRNKPKENSEGAATIPEGSRNNELVSLAGKLQNTGLAPAAILAALSAENEAKCRPHLDPAEVKKIADSIVRYPPKSPGPDFAEDIMRLVLDQHFAGGEHLLYCSDGQFWVFDGRKWGAVPRKWLEGRVLETIQSLPERRGKTTSSIVGQVASLLEAKLATKDDLLRFTKEPPAVINCRNGELWIGQDGTVDLRPHNPKSYLRHCLDVVYDAQAECPLYDRAVRDIFSPAEDRDDMVRHWHELVGYLIQQRRVIPMIVILLGDGNNGKTVMVQTQIRLLGDGLVSTQRIDNLDKNRFALGSLLDKLLLIDDDVRAGVRLPDGELKKISEAKTVTGERKHGPQFNFVVRTVPVLLCNNIPSLADVSHGMLRRLMVIPFDRTFKEGKDLDSDLFPKVWATELSGVLNRAIKGLRRVVKRGMRMDLPTTIRKAKERWLQQANPLPAFIEDHCTKDSQASCLLKEFYRQYREWAAEMGYTKTQQYLSVRRNLEHLGYSFKKTNCGRKVLGLRINYSKGAYFACKT